MRLNDINSFWPGDYEMSLTVERHRQQRFRKNNVTKIYCEVNKSNGVKSRVTLDQTTSLQLKSILSKFYFVTHQLLEITTQVL